MDDARGRTALGILIGAIAAAVIVGLVIVLNVTAQERDRALAWQEHSYEAMILTRSVDASIGQAEAMLGRYVISGSDKGRNIGREYFDQWRTASVQLDALEKQATDSSTRALIGELRQAFRVRGQELADVALRTNYGQNPQALSKFYDAGQSPTVRRISTLLDRVMDNERRLLLERSRSAERKVSRSNAVAAAFSVVGVLLVLGGGFLAWSLAEAYATRRTEEDRAQALETAVALRTQELRLSNERLRTESLEREAAEAQLRQAQKLEAVGQLTGGIAHDFNNMLAVVINGLELARRRWGNDAGRRHLESALDGASRAAALTKRLLSFARSEPLNAAPTDAGVLVADMSEMLDRVIGDRIQVRIAAAPGLWPVLVDRHQLENALLNLAVNARDAMPEGGLLTLTTANATLAAGQAAELPAGDYVRISVTDTGVGMTPDLLERIFEPFFTTKRANEGTGLGLSQIFGFVRQSGGAVHAQSAPGEGTTMSVFLPRHAGHQASDGTARESEARPATQHAGPCRVLVIEDDPRVLAATVDALEELGHYPIPCPVAADAFRILASDSAIELIVSDVMMPGMTGPQLVSQIKTTHPDLPVLFVTGYADVEGEGIFEGAAVLRKPFTIAGLEAAVASLLQPPVKAAA